MTIKVSKKISLSERRREKRKRKIRSSVLGTAERPRLTVFRSLSGIYCQLVDDVAGVTLAAASSKAKGAKEKLKDNKEGAKAVGEMLAKAALAKSIKQVVFDRNGYLYHGKIKALADGARAGGLKF